MTEQPGQEPAVPLSSRERRDSTKSRLELDPTRKHRTRRWRERAESNRQFWAERDRNAGESPPGRPRLQLLESRLPHTIAKGSASAVTSSSPGSAAHHQNDDLARFFLRSKLAKPRRNRWRAPRQTPTLTPVATKAAALADALRATPDWSQVEQLVLDFAETVEDQDEAGLAYRVAYDALDATQGASWLDPALAAAFLEDVAAQGQREDSEDKLRFVSANITAWSANIFKWHRHDKGPLLIQELHMGDEAVQRLKVDALSQGYHLFVPPVQGARPVKGGIATLVPVHCQGRFRGGYLTDSSLWSSPGLGIPSS